MIECLCKRENCCNITAAEMEKKNQTLKFDDKYSEQVHNNSGGWWIGGTEGAPTFMWASLPLCRLERNNCPLCVGGDGGAGRTRSGENGFVVVYKGSEPEVLSL